MFSINSRIQVSRKADTNYGKPGFKTWRIWNGPRKNYTDSYNKQNKNIIQSLMSARQKHTDSVLMDPALSNEQNEIMFKHVFEHTERGLKGILLSKWLTKRTTTHILTTPPPSLSLSLSLSHSLSLSLSFLFSFWTLVQFTHINVRNIYIHACSIK